MAIGYIIGSLQLLSAAVNVLALGSFWITPGLRTTANRFVINLLIVNIVGCLALTPALWLHGGLMPEPFHSEIQPIYDNAEPFTSTTSTPLHTLPDDFGFGFGSTVKPAIIVEIFEQNDDIKMTANIRIDEKQQQQNRTKIQATNQKRSPTKNIQYSDCTRFWGFDLVAALGKSIYNYYYAIFFIFINKARAISFLIKIRICFYRIRKIENKQKQMKKKRNEIHGILKSMW